MRKKSLMHQNCIKLTQRYFIKEKTIPCDKIISSTYMGWLLEKEDFPRDLLILARFEPYQILNQDESSLGNPFFSYSQIYGIFILYFISAFFFRILQLFFLLISHQTLPFLTIIIQQVFREHCLYFQH